MFYFTCNHGLTLITLPVVLFIARSSDDVEGRFKVTTSSVTSWWRRLCWALMILWANVDKTSSIIGNMAQRTCSAVLAATNQIIRMIAQLNCTTVTRVFLYRVVNKSKPRSFKTPSNIDWVTTVLSHLSWTPSDGSRDQGVTATPVSHKNRSNIDKWRLVSGKTIREY